LAFQRVLFDQTSAANTSLDTGALNIASGPFDAVLIELSPSAAMTTGNIQLFDPDLSTNELVHFASGTSATPVLIGWGVGVGSAASATTYLGGLPAPLSKSIRVVTPALGAAVTGRLRIVGMHYGR
jgi:hypothetical protein